MLLRPFLAFKEMQLSWDIHPSVTWMAFSSKKLRPDGSGFGNIFGALEVDSVWASNFPYFFIFKRGFKRPLGLCIFRYCHDSFFFNIRPPERAMKTPQDGEKGGSP